ncbi:hypothetical protein AURDEDRAFT_178197 [Auricularia subglabra TFB-10046 SS5]|uniref:Uncharacterized protein n=1 Tax=Auricularia subglabra (strain TFB-10046 / SS5) TaxID=717982 RepID=J0WLP1_AURST|nr:hypothetical protein AURDEDRAFT_178197 [Auricularia subglabra TFB-10046 SS5]
MGHRIGESALSADNRLLAITDLAGAVKIYEILPTGLRLFRTFSSPVDKACNYPLQVCFAESQSIIVSGSGSGENDELQLTITKYARDSDRDGQTVNMDEPTLQMLLMVAVASVLSTITYMLVPTIAELAPRVLAHCTSFWTRHVSGWLEQRATI